MIIKRSNLIVKNERNVNDVYTRDNKKVNSFINLPVTRKRHLW